MFRIGFPVDGGDPESSFAIVVSCSPAEYHSCKDGDISKLRENSGAEFVFSRAPLYIRDRYRYEFSLLPP